MKTGHLPIPPQHAHSSVCGVGVLSGVFCVSVIPRISPYFLDPRLTTLTPIVFPQTDTIVLDNSDVK